MRRISPDIDVATAVALLQTVDGGNEPAARYHRYAIRQGGPASQPTTQDARGEVGMDSGVRRPGKGSKATRGDPGFGVRSPRCSVQRRAQAVVAREGDVQAATTCRRLSIVARSRRCSICIL